MWRDNIFACKRYGLLHPFLLYALCCPFVLLGQIMTRLKLDWKGDKVGSRGLDYLHLWLWWWNSWTHQRNFRCIDGLLWRLACDENLKSRINDDRNIVVVMRGEDLYYAFFISATRYLSLRGKKQVPIVKSDISIPRWTWRGRVESLHWKWTRDCIGNSSILSFHNLKICSCYTHQSTTYTTQLGDYCFWLLYRQNLFLIDASPLAT